MKSDVYVLHLNYFILEFLNVTLRSDSVGNERTAEPQNNNQDGAHVQEVSQNLEERRQETDESGEINAAEDGESSAEHEENEEGDATIPYAEEIDQNYTGEEDEAVKERWVKNVSNRSLSEHEISLLRKGGGFAVTPRELPNVDFITATECACRNLAKGEALSLRAEIVEELGKAKLPASNLTSEEWKAMKTLREDENILVLPADKGKCLVVMDTEEYIAKMEEKLSDQSTYKQIEKDPTEELKMALSNHLNKVKDEGQLDNKTFFRLFPTKTRIPRMYGQPKIHKPNYPLREIVDSTSSAAKQSDKYISKIIQKYTGKTIITSKIQLIL